MSTQKLYHFYHIYADGHWKKIVFQHLNVLRKSALLRDLDGFYIGIIGTDENLLKVQRFLNLYSFFCPLNYTIQVHSYAGWEQTTLDALYDFSLTHPGKVLYAHTKGAAYPSKTSTRWRKQMSHYNIKKWKTAITHLDTHQAVGCYWLLPKDLPYGGYYFAGNYWWANLTFIKTLGKPKRESRFDAEAWLGSHYETHPFPFYDLHPHFSILSKHPFLSPLKTYLKSGLKKILGDHYFNRLKMVVKPMIKK